MNKEIYLNRLKDGSKNMQMMEAIRCLEPHIQDVIVLDALCETAVEISCYNVREVLIEILKKNPAEANKRFIDYAMESPDPIQRRRALINLSLMECRTAKKAVLRGLRDAFEKVRIAAAFNAGLYDDKEVRDALEYFFETNQLAGAGDFVGLMVKRFRQIRRPKINIDMDKLLCELRRTPLPYI